MRKTSKKFNNEKSKRDLKEQRTQSNWMTSRGDPIKVIQFIKANLNILSNSTILHYYI